MPLISWCIVCMLEFQYIKLQRGSNEDGQTLQKRAERMGWNNFACVIDIMGFGIRGALKIQQSSIVDWKLTVRKRLWFFFVYQSKVCFIRATASQEFSLNLQRPRWRTFNCCDVSAFMTLPAVPHVHPSGIECCCECVYQCLPAVIFVFLLFKRSIQPKNKGEYINKSGKAILNNNSRARNWLHFAHTVSTLSFCRLNLPPSVNSARLRWLVYFASDFFPQPTNYPALNEWISAAATSAATIWNRIYHSLDYKCENLPKTIRLVILVIRLRREFSNVRGSGVLSHIIYSFLAPRSISRISMTTKHSIFGIHSVTFTSPRHIHLVKICSGTLSLIGLIEIRIKLKPKISTPNFHTNYLHAHGRPNQPFRIQCVRF